MTAEQSMLQKKISANQFAAWELHLFLDTHPNNVEAQAKFAEYRKKTDKLVKEYEAMYGPLTEKADDVCHWSWVNDPWPWETEGN